MMGIIKIHSTPTHKSLMRKTKWDLASQVMSLLTELAEVKRDRELLTASLDRKVDKEWWYSCPAGVFNGTLNHVEVHAPEVSAGDWVVPLDCCHATHEEAVIQHEKEGEE